VKTPLILFIAIIIANHGLAETPISSVPYAVSAPGVYFLANDIFSKANAKITITASNVLLDLQGRTLQVAATDECIFVDGGSNVTVQNGVLVNTVGGCISLAGRNCVIDHIIATSASVCTFCDQGGTNNRINHCVFASGTLSQGPATAHGDAPVTVFLVGCSDLFEDNIVTSYRQAWAIESVLSPLDGVVLGNALRNNMIRDPYSPAIQLDQFDTYSGNMFPGQPAGNVNVSGGVPATD
jgi:hypothetical protein